MINLTELVYDPATRRDVATKIPLDYTPSIYQTKGSAAVGLYDALVKLATKTGQAASEVSLWAPEESHRRGYGSYWMVSWEAGPHDWAIGASYQITGPWGYTEPYHGFDLCFTD